MGTHAPFHHLIYPVPEPGGLGIHLTLDLTGQARFGPDVEWVEEIDYNVDSGRAQKFYATIRRYWPDLRDGSLIPAYAGIRPKTTRQGEKQGDFIIQGPTETGHPAYIALYGIEVSRSYGVTGDRRFCGKAGARLKITCFSPLVVKFDVCPPSASAC